MSFGLYMDEHVRSAITRGLRAIGVDVLTVQEDGHRTLDDITILDRAIELGRIVFTSDDDFLKEAARRRRESIPFASIAFIEQEDVHVGRCIEDLALIAQTTYKDEVIGQIWYLPL